MGHGDIVIAAITSCTNTSNPSVMIGAGLLAKKAIERGLKVVRGSRHRWRPGSQIVTDYLAKAGLDKALDKLGFDWSGTAARPASEIPARCRSRSPKPINERRSVAVAVLSGNRNFEGRVHPQVRANYLGLADARRRLRARRIDGKTDLTPEPLGQARITNLSIFVIFGLRDEKSPRPSAKA